jgi:hypothetical protein
MQHEAHKTYISLYFFLWLGKLLLIHGKCSKIKNKLNKNLMDPVKI